VTRPLRTELTLPNNADILTMARRYACNLSEMAQLSDEDADRLVEAVVEACENVLEHAFEPDEDGKFIIAGELTPSDLMVSIRDNGLPFDPLRHQRPDGQAGGLARIRQAVDKLQWVHHGREGKELQLVKRRPKLDITEQLSEDQLAHIEPDAPLAPEQEYTIRLLQPGDAVGVSRCIYRVYGNSYLHDDCYYPERIAEQNEDGHLVSVVAIDQDGEVVGHYALERPRITRVAERGMAVVSPEHRGRDLMGRMRVFIEEEAQRRGLVSVFSVAVTEHVYSQRVNEEFESDVVGFYLGGGPSNTVFRKIGAEKAAQRVSWVIYNTYVEQPEKTVVHAPARHLPIIERIYANLGANVEYREPGPIPEAEGDLEVRYSHSMDFGTIYVNRIGEDTEAEIRRSTEDLVEITGAEVVQVELPLAQSGTPALCEELEGLGYFFAGIGPSFLEDGDALLLSYVPVEMDPSRIKIANSFAQELCDYAFQERARNMKLNA
jgi:anti-sigma regulatory factor (Ser/Thr protein kinase)